MAFKAKDLHYEKQEPAFLRRLRGEVGGDRHNVSIPRPGKPRLDTGDDDGPTIVDEAGDSVTKEEYEAMSRAIESKDDAKTSETSGDADSNQAVDGHGMVKEHEDVKGSEKLVSIGSSSKRRHGKIIGHHDGEEQGEETEVANGKTKETAVDSKSTNKSIPKPKKKKIKLSFDEDGT